MGAKPTRRIGIISAFSLLIAALLFCIFFYRDNDSPATFVQISDLHLFDEGKPRNEDVQPDHKLWKENEETFDWAIKKIKKIKDLKFVVFTGDLGLEMTGPYWEDQAAQYLANRLSGLDVSYIFFVPGNNDLLNEEPKDIGRYQSFLTALKHKSNKIVVDLSKESNHDIPGLILHGLNSATFKNSTPCMIGFNPPLDQMVPKDQKDPNGPKIPNPNIPKGLTNISFSTPNSTTQSVKSLWCKISDIKDRLGHQEREMERLSDEVNKETSKVHLIFTHIPPLDDPFLSKVDPLPILPKLDPLPRKLEDQTEALWQMKVAPMPWNLDPRTLKIWMDKVAKAKHLQCVFAAHFHTYQKKYYGIDDRDKGNCDRGIVVAPPLAIKFQDEDTIRSLIEKKEAPSDTVPARGFLKGIVAQDGTVSYQIIWKN